MSETTFDPMSELQFILTDADTARAVLTITHTENTNHVMLFKVRLCLKFS